MNRGPKAKPPEVSTEAYTKLPDPPECLGEWGQYQWFAVGPTLIANGRLSRANKSLFLMYCKASERWYTSMAGVDSDGQSKVNDKGAPYLNPDLSAESMATSTMLKIDKLFGISPASSAKLPSTKAVGDELDAFKGGE